MTASSELGSRVDQTTVVATAFVAAASAAAFAVVVFAAAAFVVGLTVRSDRTWVVVVE